MQVRQVEENDPKDTVHSTTSTAASSAVRAVQFLGDVSTFEPAVVEPFVEELTVLSQPSISSSPFKLCMVAEVCNVCSACIKADMTCTDHDLCWTVCPEINQCCCAES